MEGNCRRCRLLRRAPAVAGLSSRSRRGGDFRFRQRQRVPGPGTAQPDRPHQSAVRRPRKNNIPRSRLSRTARRDLRGCPAPRRRVTQADPGLRECRRPAPIAKADPDDPYVLASDSALLISHRYELLRFWNGGAVGSYLTVAPDRKRAVAHLLFLRGPWARPRECAHPGPLPEGQPVDHGPAGTPSPRNGNPKGCRGTPSPGGLPIRRRGTRGLALV